jgi:hypothetical protein
MTHVAIPSYARAGYVRALDVFPTATLYVPMCQVDEYNQASAETAVLGVPDRVDGIGTVALKRNWIMDHSPERRLVMVDDDVRRFGYWEHGVRRFFAPDEVLEFIERAFVMADDMNVPVWGVNPMSDKRGYGEMRPFSFLAPITGPFTAHRLDHGIRCDPKMGTKEDYDFWLQVINRYRMTLRFNKYHWVKDEQSHGGLYTTRTMDRERADADAITRKWGARVITYKETTKSILDPVSVNVPIAGI